MNEMKTAWETRKKQITKTAAVAVTVVVAYKLGTLVGQNQAITAINSDLSKQLLKHLYDTTIKP